MQVRPSTISLACGEASLQTFSTTLIARVRIASELLLDHAPRAASDREGWCRCPRAEPSRSRLPPGAKASASNSSFCSSL